MRAPDGPVCPLLHTAEGRWAIPRVPSRHDLVTGISRVLGDDRVRQDLHPSARPGAAGCVCAAERAGAGLRLRLRAADRRAGRARVSRGARSGCLGGADRAGAAGASGAGALRCPGFPLPFEDGAFDAALLFAVLTCVPRDADQTAITEELGRLVRPGGVLYLSDVPLQGDALNRGQYARFAARYGTYGVFETPDGGVFRHHPPERLRGLVREAGFSVRKERAGSVATLDGRTAERLQIIARREPVPPDPSPGPASG